MWIYKKTRAQASELTDGSANRTTWREAVLAVVDRLIEQCDAASD